MNRLVSYAGVVLALACAAALITFFGLTHPSKLETAAPSAASSTVAVVADVPTADSPHAAATTSASTSPQASPSLVPAEAARGTPAAPTTVIPPAGVTNTATAAAPEENTTQSTSAATTGAHLSGAAALLRGALVNIICYAPLGSGFHSISASGVIITASGLVLTNAHAAQYFLLQNKGISCTLRSGSPATNAYKAQLAYLPKSWLEANQNVLRESEPSGTGEHDYALLAITASTSNAPLPDSFSFIPLASTAIGAGTPVVIASYGAQFLTTSQVQTALFPTVVYGSIQKVYTFVQSSIDVLALGGSAAAQEGSSGGGVASAAGTLAGTITTSTVTGNTADRELNAITAAYIRADYASENGQPIDFLLSEAPSEAVQDFATQAPSLEAIILGS